MATITAANSVFMLGIANLFNIPVKMQGYAADDAFATDEVELMEKFMGVDGKLSAGFIPYIIQFDFNLQADSASNALMDALIAAEKIAREKFVLNATIILPSTGFIYAFTTGYLDKASVMPGAGKVLKPRKYSLAFQDLSVAPI